MRDKIEDLKWCIGEYGILKGILYSGIFDPIYRLINLPKRLYNYLYRFCYYGKAGASNTHDFCASGIDHLIYAHIKRVRKFMDSDKTHLVWNSKRSGLMKKLYEFEELCKRKCKNDDLNDMYYFSKVLKKYERGTEIEIVHNGQTYYTYEQTEEVKKLKINARKKDEKIAKQRLDRYYELLRKYAPQFWD